MHRPRLHPLAAWLLLLCGTARPAGAQVDLVVAFPHLSFSAPVGLEHPPDGSDRIFVVEQAGGIKVFPNTPSALSARTFLDIHERVVSGGEMGLLGLAFHPGYASNRTFYAYYTADNPLRSVVSRFRASASNPDSAVADSEMVILEVEQPFDNHNGGQISFGPDGYLYIGLGDGGSGGDPFDNAQNTSTLLGKILRIDVDSVTETENYAIPPGNPFAADTGGARGEIYAYGLRNPWRFSFDAAGGALWVGDVGQGSWEEVDLVGSGANCGWRVAEGYHCYNPSSGCDTSGFTQPVWEYFHSSNGECSITGGTVYRGSKTPSLTGRYVYGDYCTGEIWALDTSFSGPPVNTSLSPGGFSISSFGTDQSNELYVCSYNEGILYRFTENAPDVPELIQPADGDTGVPTITTLRWNDAQLADRYHVQVAFDGSFSPLYAEDSSVVETWAPFSAHPAHKNYTWRVRALNGAGAGGFSPPRSFSTSDSFVVSTSMAQLWNLVSLPVRVDDPRRSAVFPAATTSAFAFVPSAGYEQRDSLLPRTGYWLKFPDPTISTVGGAAVPEDTFHLVAGWNLVGSISAAVDAGEVIQNPPGFLSSQWFSYAAGYEPAETIAPGRGYWVKAKSAGTLVISSK